MSIFQYSMTRVRSILFTLVCLALLVLPGQAVARVGRGAAVTVGTSATPLRDESVPQTARRAIAVCVPEAAAGPVYVGGAGATASTGMPVDPGRCYSVILDPGEVLYGIVESGSVAVRVQERSL